MRIFVDTSAIVAVSNLVDPNNILAVEILQKVQVQAPEFVISNYVIAEILTVLSQKVSKSDAIQFKEEKLEKMEVVRINEYLEHQAFEIFKKIKSKNVSFVDCTSFALMQSLGIKTVFTFDKDFKKQGFRILQ